MAVPQGMSFAIDHNLMFPQGVLLVGEIQPLAEALRLTVLADAVGDSDHHAAVVAREEAAHLRYRAPVVEELFELYNELGSQLRALDVSANGSWRQA